VFDQDHWVVEQSIHHAYVHQIRRASRFIYVENQYFLGSSQYWARNENDEISARMLIPFEIANKIIQKIKARQRFCAYIVIPLYPEGIAGSKAVQEILQWQFRTMKMMYDKIHRFLFDEGLLGQVHPCDYLSFFCLGNRETTEGSQQSTAAPLPGSKEELLNQTRRHMIYVHAKMMIVDDEYIILGSANCNQRSMDGQRDTEIAVGCFQPGHTVASVSGEDKDGPEGFPRGLVHAFRLSLWAEHTHRVLPEFDVPHTIECMRLMNDIGRQNWEIFIGNQVVDMSERGHLMRYPINFDHSGYVEDIHHHSHLIFPDTHAAIVGGNSLFMPNLVTL